jgi:hypothetical protein
VASFLFSNAREPDDPKDRNNGRGNQQFGESGHAIALIAGGFGMVGIAQALRLLLLIYHQAPL